LDLSKEGNNFWIFRLKISEKAAKLMFVVDATPLAIRSQFQRASIIHPL